MSRISLFVTGLVFTTSCLAAAVSSVSSSCSGQQYNTLPGFPASNSGCYPTSYSSTSDLGNTSPSDAQTRCQQQCTSMGSSCSSVVAQVNKAADSNLYSGTCFYYGPSQTPSGPRQCADTAYLLLGYYKDSTNDCFSSSKAAATSFCSSYLGIPVYTVSKTTTPTTTTLTTTATSKPTSYVTTTISATSTIISTVSTTATTTVATSTATQTSTATATTTVTVTGGAVKKRAVTTVPAPACVSANTPATRLSAACSCLSVTQSTTTTTLTAPQPSSTVTTTTVIPVTSTISTTVTRASVTNTNTQTITTSVTATITTTSTTTSTTTTTVHVAAPTQTFTLQAQYSDATNTNVFSYNVALNGAAYFINFSSDPTVSIQYSLDPATGTLTVLTGPAAEDASFYSESVGATSFVLVTTAAFAASQGGQLLVCSLSTTQQLTCNFKGQTAAFWLCGGHLNVVTPGYDFTSSCNQGTATQLAGLLAVPV